MPVFLLKLHKKKNEAVKQEREHVILDVTLPELVPFTFSLPMRLLLKRLEMIIMTITTLKLQLSRERGVGWRPWQ